MTKARHCGKCGFVHCATTSCPRTQPPPKKASFNYHSNAKRIEALEDHVEQLQKLVMSLSEKLATVSEHLGVLAEKKEHRSNAKREDQGKLRGSLAGIKWDGKDQQHRQGFDAAGGGRADPKA